MPKNLSEPKALLDHLSDPDNVPAPLQKPKIKKREISRHAGYLAAEIERLRKEKKVE